MTGIQDAVSFWDATVRRLEAREAFLAEKVGEGIAWAQEFLNETREQLPIARERLAVWSRLLTRSTAGLSS
jgi:hypothetical protein